MEEKLNNILKSVNYNNEVEFKFKHKNINKKDIEKVCNSWFTKKPTQEESIVYIFPNGLRIIETAEKKIYEQKRRILNKKIYDDVNYLKTEFGINFSESSERTIDSSWFSDKNKYIMKRTRKRTSYQNKSFRVDLSFIKEDSNYELEVEVIKQNDNVYELIMKLLRAIQNTSIPLSNTTINIVKNVIKTFLKQEYFSFPGPLPHTVKQDTLNNISCGYAISDKSDGERAIILIDSNQHCFSIKRNKNIHYIGNTKHPKNYIYDSELIDDKYYIFDVLYANKDVRELSYIDRYKYINNDNKVFYKKPVYFENISQYIQTIDQTKNYKTDGIIFTPIYKKYYNEKIYKWKSKNTIDFYCTKIENNKYRLEIAGLSKDGVYMHFPFSGIDGKGTFYIDGEYITNDIFKNAKDTIEIKNKSESFVGEFHFMPQKKEWKLERIRDDKTFANHVKTVNDAWDAISNPIRKNNLSEVLKFNCSRILHNKIKKELILKYTSDKHVLNIGIGAGGNFKKYTNAKVLSLVGIDIKDYQYEFKNLDFTFYKVKNNSFKIKDITSKKFDIVCSFFAIHYFFKSRATIENLINNIKFALHPNGIFICTFMEKSKVLNIINKKHNLFHIKQLSNNQIEVKVNGTQYFKNESSKEYLVDTKLFTTLLKENGFEVISKKSFDEYKDLVQYKILSNDEKIFTSLHTALVVKKIAKNVSLVN